MTNYRGLDVNTMMSLFTKEATYDAGVTVSAANFCGMPGHLIERQWPDENINDGEEHTGSEHPTDFERLSERASFNYEEPHARPNSLAGLMALVLGSITSTQDGTATAYSHKIVPIAQGTALPSIEVQHKESGQQREYTGIRGNSIELSAEAGKFFSMKAELIGSGSRATAADTFEAALSEPRLHSGKCSVWKEAGTDISISASLVQSAEDISSATADDMKALVRSFSFKYTNGLEGEPGFGGGLNLQELDISALRQIELTMALKYADASLVSHYENGDTLALELDLDTGTLVDASGTVKYGFHLVFPSLRIMEPPLPGGGKGEVRAPEVKFLVVDDGTNPVVIFETYTAKAAYLA